ncbi:KH domain-containing protein [Loa loa]|uniref:KH domain-containing protein n=1 Tax=Loa loa TaxID=7209 RepID=A0A1I7VS12_LOALO|nr:KH domain-containing protein [Loa loa]EJD75804.1 KH domain-containing protein [Loa loa]
MEKVVNYEQEKSIESSDIANEGSLNLAPGAERYYTALQNGGTAGASGINHPETGVSVLDYSTDFPELPDKPNACASQLLGGVWNKPPAVRSERTTQVYHLSGDERASRTGSKNFGNTNEEQQKCNEIAIATGTQIEICEAKDHSLTLLITGKRQRVEEARSHIARKLKTQAAREIAIPKEHHRVLIGREGIKLRQLEQDTDCRIMVPGRDSPSDIIKIIGPRDGIEKAVHEIQLVSDKQSKLAQEHLMIPRVYYPFIRGPFNETIDELASKTGAKINIPPPTASSEVIVISGEKEGVHRAAAAVRQIYENMKTIAKPVTCEVARAQHRYIVGPQRRGLAEILKSTGVSVEVPPEEEDSDTITLRGDPTKLGEALAMVYAKASSVITAEITCESWMHKFLIGPKGTTLENLVPNKDKVQIAFEQDGLIYLEGAPEEVKKAHTSLLCEIKRLTEEMTSETIKVSPSLHRHVIGRGGALISKIKDETGVQISIPNEQTNSDEIKIEGNKEGVKKAIEEITEIVKRIENEKTRDILIEQRFHKQLIGAKGETVQKLREQFPSVIFSFPDPGKKSDIVNLRGDRVEVDKAYKQLTAMNKELLESNFQMTVPIFKEFHKHIIGKGGANIRKIREETQTRIDLPGGETGEDKITVTGKKANVEKAVEQLTKIQNELANIITVEVNIPQKIHSRLLGGGRRLIFDIQDECGGVHIKFPPEKTTSNKVSIRGPKDDVARAEKMLMALAKDRELSSFEDSVSAKPEFHRFIIGRGGSRIKKIREMYSDVRILFPRETDTDKDIIHLVGKKEDITEVKKQLEAMITELNENVEVRMEVDPKHHRHFVIRGAAVLREIQDQNGGVIISFPRAGTNDSRVTLKGSKQCVECAKARIEEIVEDLESQVTLKVEIPGEYHRALLSNRGQKIQELQSKYNVQIKFPDRRLRENTQNENERNVDDGPSLLDTITISGRDARCKEAAEALKALVPVTRTVSVAFEHHRFLIGRSGETIRSLMQAHDVNISIPPEDTHLDEIVITGTTENVESAVADILKRVGELEEAAEIRRLRSFKLTFDAPSEYHVRLIGPRGKVVNELRAKHDVLIAFPRSNNDPPDTITLTGYEANCNACKEEMEAMIGEAQSLFTQEIFLDATFHPRLIGQKGRNLKKVMDEFKVEIRLPRSSDPDPNLVVIAGKDEDAVYDCIEQLRREEEEFLQERRQYMSPRVTEQPPLPPRVEVEIKGAPWQLDMQSEEQFPTMGTAQATAAAAGAWSGVRRF